MSEEKETKDDPLEGVSADLAGWYMYVEPRAYVNRLVELAHQQMKKPYTPSKLEQIADDDPGTSADLAGGFRYQQKKESA